MSENRTDMKKECPNLVALDDQALRDFWAQNRPEGLKRLGDRLLAESLPRFEARAAEFYSTELASLRQGRNLSSSQMAQTLGINPTILAAWESGEVRPPASLLLIYQGTN